LKDASLNLYENIVGNSGGEVAWRLSGLSPLPRIDALGTLTLSIGHFENYHRIIVSISRKTDAHAKKN